MFKKSPALFVLLFVVAGILIADTFRLSVSYFFIAMICFVVGSLFCYKSQKEIMLVLCIGLGLLSFTSLRFAILYYEQGVNHVSHFTDNKTMYTIYGKVSDWPELKLDRTELIIEIDSLESASVNYVEGKVLLKINSVTTAFQRGDQVVLRSRIYAVQGESFSKDFNYNRFLRYKQISGVVYQTTPLQILHDKVNKYSVIPFVDLLREAISSSLHRNLSEVSASLASGFLIGETRDIPPELYKRFKDSGTLHLLAVSGSNVILVITFFSFLLSPFAVSRKRRALLLMAFVLLFCLLSYGEPSVVRASIMAGLVLLASLVEKRFELSNIIAVAAMMILLYEPSQLFDIGFQLSFVVAWGLILVVPKINQLFDKYHRRKWYKYLLFPFLISITAQIFSIGLIGLYFKQIPLLSPIANLFIVPLVSIAVIGVLVLLVADLILPLLGLFVGSILNVLMEFTVFAVELFGAESMPFAHVFDWSILGVCGLYLILFIAPFALFSKTKRRLVLFSILIFLNIIMLSKTVDAFKNSDSVNIFCFGVPGGNVAIVNPKNEKVDIIINGIKGRTYNIDDKIIVPKLLSQNVQEIDKLIVLKSDFSAIDDLLRLAKKYKAQRIYLPKKLENSFKDQIKNLHVDSISLNIIALNTNVLNKGEVGYVFDNQGFSLVTKSSIVRFVDKLSEVHFEKLSENQRQYLVIGSNWNISQYDYLHLKEVGYQQVVCSKIKLSQSVESIDFDEKSTEFVVDLYKRTDYTIKLGF